MIKPLIFLSLTIQLTSAATHSLLYYFTGITEGFSFPMFTVVGQLDEEQLGYYNSRSRTVTIKADWLNKVKSKEEAHWHMMEVYAASQLDSSRFRLDDIIKIFRQSRGLHTFQEIFGCELDDDGTRRGYWQMGYDGEDVSSLNLKTGNWTVAAPFKGIFQEREVRQNEKNLLLEECIDWLQMYVGYGKATLERKVSPEVTLFQKNLSSPVVCHATGFFPKAVMIYWQKNGEDLHEDVELRETVPNNDGTFQKRSLLTKSPEDLGKHNYTCVVEHSSLEKEVQLQVADLRVRTGGGSGGVIIGVVLTVLLLVIMGCVGVFIWKKKSFISRCVPVSII